MVANYEKGLYQQYEETVTRLEKVTAKMEEMERRYEAKISEMEAEHKREVAALKEEIRVRDEKIKELTAKNDALTEEVTRLKSIINTDSHNSSNPPSTDGKGNSKKANEYPSRIKSGKKQGGQNGHKGKTLTLLSNRLASLGVPLLRLAISIAPVSSTETPILSADFIIIDDKSSTEYNSR